MIYKIVTMGPSERFKTQYGEMAKYNVQFEGSNDWVQINQKPETPAPNVGDEVEGEIELTQWGAKFKKAQKFPQGGGGGFKPRTDDPSTRRSIERQSSLGHATAAVQSFYTVSGNKAPTDLKKYASEVVDVAEIFENHVAGASDIVLTDIDEGVPF